MLLFTTTIIWKQIPQKYYFGNRLQVFCTLLLEHLLGVGGGVEEEPAENYR